MPRRNIYDRELSFGEIDTQGEMLWTGIKVLDFFAPMQKGYKMGLLGGAGVGKTVLIKELINNVYKGCNPTPYLSAWVSAAERARNSTTR